VLLLYVFQKGCTRLGTTSDKVYQLLAHGRWFSPGTLASSTTTTGRHDIAEILLKVALNTKNQSINQICISSSLESVIIMIPDKEKFVLGYIMFIKHQLHSYIQVL
jgi:hypothetical protein